MRMGLAYNAAVWEECRRYGVEFLKEGKSRLVSEYSEAFNNAIVQYEAVAKHLKEVTEHYPFGDMSEAPIGVNETSRKTATALNQPKQAEAKGLETLETIVTLL